MTRENKLALVVGFGLILFVGILISDHFAPSQHRSNAELGDPSLAARGQKQRGLTELNPRAPMASNSGAGGSAPAPFGPAPAGPGATPSDDARASLGGSNDAPLGTGIRVPGQGVEPTPEEARARVSPPPVGPEAAPAGRLYTIRDGDTLYGIAKRELGNGSLWTSLRDLNNLKDGKSLRVGTTLRLPAAGGGIERVALGGGAVAPEEPVAREYVVREGDTLSSIAERQLGKRSRWQELHEMNKSRVKDPNHVAPGTRLLLPASTKRGTRA